MASLDDVTPGIWLKLLLFELADILSDFLDFLEEIYVTDDVRDVVRGVE